MLSVVVPTFNEGKNIRNLVTQIDEALKGIDYEILFVDDSKDDTPQIIMEVAKDFPAVRMEHRTGESGLATAVLKGFRLAKGEYMACMDADLQLYDGNPLDIAIEPSLVMIDGNIIQDYYPLPHLL